MTPLIAYVGPGAGFAILGSFLSIVISLAISAASLLIWPFRVIWWRLTGKRLPGKPQARKLIFLGLDGLDPNLTERFMAEGKLPNFSKLAAQGSFHRLRTTFPALSPVAWSTFATGVNPARHNIFDFLSRDLHTYLPELSSARVRGPRRFLKIGKLRIPLDRGDAELRRKSQPFWNILGDYHISSTVLRVPITFPPQRFNGRLLSAMCTPDLKGTQGSFSFFSTRPQPPQYTGGTGHLLRRVDGHYEGVLEGPEDCRLPFRVTASRLEINGKAYDLEPGRYTHWIPLSFGAKAITRFLITETEPEFSLYCTPLNIDPEHPALPISHPSYYAVYLSKLMGSFATLGMAEDTWALNEGVIDEAAFLEQAYLTHAERETMFFNALDRTRRGVVACVFDATDRVQHMFFRHLQNGDSSTIEDLYRRADSLVGRTLPYVDERTVLVVLSDHGFAGFRRGVNLNSWLQQNGYLVLRDGLSESGPYFDGVDWTRTRAYALGLSGLYLNVRGRESSGIVEPAEAEALEQEIAAKLTGLRDSDSTVIAIRQAYATRDVYRGPYLDAAPDLIIGYNDGYRTSWDAATGKVAAAIFEDNTQAWSGDHCIDPPLVPGVLFCNRSIQAEDPGIEDMAPTALSLFGIEPPEWMEGKPVFRAA